MDGRLDSAVFANRLTGEEAAGSGVPLYPGLLAIASSWDREEIVRAAL